MTFKEFLKEMGADPNAVVNDMDAPEEKEAEAMRLRKLANVQRQNPKRANQMQMRELQIRLQKATDPKERALIAQKIKALKDGQTNAA